MPPNKSLQQTLDPAAASAVAESTSASSATELGCYAAHETVVTDPDQRAKDLIHGFIGAVCFLAFLAVDPVKAEDHQRESNFYCGSVNSSECYWPILNLLLPLEDVSWEGISFRRVYPYYGSDLPVEATASMIFNRSNGIRSLEVKVRELVGANLLEQIGRSKQDSESEIGEFSVHWQSYTLSSESCPQLVDLWQQARIMDKSIFPSLSEFKVPPPGEDEIVAVTSDHIYEVRVESLGQTTTASNVFTGPVHDWVEGAFSVFAKCYESAN